MAGIYIHIPFCKQACTYCNFHFSTSLQLKDDLLRALHDELIMQKDYLGSQPVETIYLGGGTPSLLSADEINKLFDTITQYYKVSDLKEFTLEANPDDLTVSYLKSLRSTPINRFSIGVQSFREKDLQYMHRAHNAQQADFAIKAAQDAGFTNLSIDLIYGTPGLSDADWLYNLSQLKTLQIPHFSSYALTVEEGTALHHAIQKKKATAVDPEQAAAQFELLTEQAASMGYDHYEISNLALPGHHAIHNTNYWQGKHYLGIGPSAHSFNGSSRSWNVANNPKYIKSILQDKTRMYEEEQLTPIQHLNEYIMTSLRTMWGTDLNKIASEWDNAYAKQLENEAAIFREKRWLKMEDNKLILSNTGKLFADRIAAELFIEDNNS
ncbi:MAG: radical SAM family heme chaperone HemW [Bacteroidetes bacterium]|nr:radical SAM family heme chaperone HemW [Bacteroidota bacterium]